MIYTGIDMALASIVAAARVGRGAVIVTPSTVFRFFMSPLTTL